MTEEEIVYTHRLETSTVERIDAINRETYPDGEYCDTRIWALWHPKAKFNDDGKDFTSNLGNYWLLCGDNTGSTNLIVYPDDIDSVIDLLLEMKKRHLKK